MNRTTCPVCKGDSKNAHRNRRDYNNYDIYACSDCGCLFSIPFAAPSADFYATAADVGSEERHTTLTRWYKDHPTQDSIFLKNGKGKKLLDIGCSNGAFVEFAASRDFEVTGIDFDKESIALAKKRNLRASFQNVSLEEFYKSRPAEEKFDVITIFEVFEHVDNPHEILKLVRNLLKEGGVFIGSLPDEDRFLGRKLNLDYALPPYHLTYWTKKHWTKLLNEKYGFQIITCQSNIYYGYMANILKIKALSHFNIVNKKKNLFNVMIRGIFYIVGLVEKPVEKALGKGSSFYFETVKASV